MSRIDLVSKNLRATYFRNCRNRANCWNSYDKLIYKYRKNRKSNKCNKIQGLKREEIKEGPEMSVNIAKVTKIFLATLKLPSKISQKSQE